MKNCLVILLICTLAAAFSGMIYPEQNAPGGAAGIPIRKVASGKIIHRFHDTSPISPSGKYIALFRIPFEDHYPEAGDMGEVVLIDIATGKETVIERSFGWEMQVGANVQWGATDHELFYNQVDTSTWKAYTILHDPIRKTSRKWEGATFMVTPDGKQTASHNMINSVNAQSGYGVILPEKFRSKNSGVVNNDGLFVTDVKTGETKMIASIKRIFDEATPKIGIDDPENYEIYTFKAMWNAQGTRLMTCLIIKPKTGGPRKVALITIRPDGTEIRTAITTKQYSKGGHHMAWMPDGDHFSMNLEVDSTKNGLELITARYDGSEIKTVFSPGSGHPSFHPKGLPLIITDAYNHEKSVAKGDGIVPIRLMNTKTGKEILLANVRVPSVKDNSFRMDAHPTWDRTGRYVIFNGYDDNNRGVYIADLQKTIEELKP
ncbi:TolB-like translocation protein [Dyadobacter aurulentus]|uniref:hypothetical protein n=1 Tax=Dyadobacter sp. UC 10 TaxID=2605428 RepID=UPI0011F39A28|nr:hypothetical protein [Dyadobacter sp. UC 10]KAA0992254.1 hypothetical protein FXO21_19760 [Dyadobacter sp. UC 10]